MHVVAIAELTQPLETEKLKALALALDTTAYELRLLLNAGLPAVVRVTVEPELAQRAFDALKAQGLRAVRCDSSQIVGSSAMTQLGQFELGGTHLVPDVGSTELCPYTDIAALIKATHRVTSEVVEKSTERKLRPVMAVATGGLVMSKKETKEVTTTTASREQVLYIFRQGGVPPLLLRERAANYAGLKTEMAPSSFENFARTIAKLRKAAPQAIYDERLVTSRPIRGLGDGPQATDLLAYLVAGANAR